MEETLATIIMSLAWFFAFVPGVGHLFDEGNMYLSKTSGYGECLVEGLIIHLKFALGCATIAAVVWAGQTLGI